MSKQQALQAAHDKGVKAAIKVLAKQREGKVDAHGYPTRDAEMIGSYEDMIKEELINDHD